MTLQRLTPEARRPSTSDKKLILYLEDDDASWEIAELALRDRFELRRAKNARQIFEMVVRERFAAVLMDIELAGSDLDGITITRQLKGLMELSEPSYARNVHQPDLPVIFISAYTARYTPSSLLEAGGDDVIPKPVNVRALTAALTKLTLKAASSLLQGRPSSGDKR
ncbi:MAG: response regulator [Deltaproteobacteria bacterium]|nr:response regulator [Deltaproteobacteria bacterium]